MHHLFLTSIWLAAALGIQPVLAISSSAAKPARQQSFSFGAIADVQHADKEVSGARAYRESLPNLQKCVAELNRHELLFTIQLGDIIDGNQTPQQTRADLDRILAAYSQIQGPAYHVVGNHCLNAGKDALHETLGLKSFYYDFAFPEVAGWRFVVLDGNDAGYGVVSEPQVKWLRETLQRTRRDRERVIVFNHFPLIKDAAKQHRMKTTKPLLPLIEESGNVVAYIAGHEHVGGYALHNGIHHITMKGMVDAPAQNAYAIFTVSPQRIEEIGYGQEPSRQLPIGPVTNR